MLTDPPSTAREEDDFAEIAQGIRSLMDEINDCAPPEVSEICKSVLYGLRGDINKIDVVYQRDLRKRIAQITEEAGACGMTVSVGDVCSDAPLKKLSLEATDDK